MKAKAGLDQINIGGDGTLQPVKPFVCEPLGGDQWRVQINVRPGRELEEILPHLAATLRITEERLREQLAKASASVTTQRLNTVHHSFEFGGPEANRSFVKASLVLWSTLTGNAEVRSEAYSAAREFVVDGDLEFNLAKTHIDLRHTPHADSMVKRFGPMFNLIYVRSDETGRVIGHFTFYNLISWCFVLAETGGVPNAKMALISNPIEPRNWSDGVAEEFDIPFDWLKHPDDANECERYKARLDAILTPHFERVTKDALLQEIEQSFQDVGFKPGAKVTIENKALIDTICQRLSHFQMRLPYTRQLSADQFAEKFEVKKSLD